MKKKKDPNVCQICVVIPAFKVKAHIIDVITSIGPEVNRIIVVDDKCPEKSGDHVMALTKDPRVEVIFHQINMGVGGAVKTGYRRALEIGSEIIVKIDGDGQMDSSRIEELVSLIKVGRADYTKGNRFFDVEAVRTMPKIRILGNLGLSFLTKLSSGYWRIFDPNNGFTAINKSKLQKMALNKIDDGYFFESDMLFRLNLIDAVVKDVSIPAIYGDEESSLKVRKILFEFPLKHLRNFLKRIFYLYYLKDFNLASIELLVGFFLFNFSLIIGAHSWIHGTLSGTPTPPGTTILVAISFLAGIQLLLAFFNFDMGREVNGDRK